MKSFLAVLAIPLAIYASSPTPSPTAVAPSEVSSYELFWPIVHGRVMGDSLYPLKGFKEKILEFLNFSQYKKVDYNISLAEKRLVEAEYLVLTKKDLTNTGKSLEVGKKKLERVLGLMGTLKTQGVNVTDLESRFRNSIEKQLLLLRSMETSVSEESKALIRDYSEYLNSLFSKI